MKIATLSCVCLGLIGALMAGLTAFGVVPGFTNLGTQFGKEVITTVAWGGLALLLLLAAIALGTITPEE